jgi:hypothetical protein
MAPRSKSPVGPLIGVALLTLALFAGVIYLYVGWEPFTGEPGFALTRSGYVGLALGLLAALVFGVGLASLVLHGKRRN